MDDRRRGGRRRRAILRALLVAASSAAALGIAEALIRIFDLSPTFEVVFLDRFQLSANPGLGYVLAPGAPDGRASINSAGMRDREFNPARPAGVFRIGVVGDSITFGNGCAQQKTYPKQLERMLGILAGGEGPRFEVLNFGVTGYNISQIVERLRSQGVDYQLDRVLYGYSLNDPQSGNLEGQVARAYRTQLEAGSWGRGALRGLARSRLFLLLRHVLSGDAPPPRVGTHVQADPEYTAFRRNRAGEYFLSLHTQGEPARRFAEGMDALARVARQHDLPIAVAIFPLLLENGTPYPAEEVHALVAEEARRRGFAVLDLLSLYREAEARFPGRVRSDFMHPSCTGHQIAAAALLSWLSDSGWIPAGPLDPSRLESPAAWAAARVRSAGRPSP